MKECFDDYDDWFSTNSIHEFKQAAVRRVFRQYVNKKGLLRGFTHCLVHQHLGWIPNGSERKRLG